jgi:hypothetical protein
MGTRGMSTEETPTMDVGTQLIDTPITYRLVESETGMCPACSGVDHRYVDAPSGQITRCCDEHRLLWIVPSTIDAQLEALRSIAPEGAEVRTARVDLVDGFGVYVFTDYGGVHVIACGSFDEVRAMLLDERAWAIRHARLRSDATAAGHDPLPSFLYQYRDGGELDPADLGPSEADPYSGRPYDTCYPGCRGCEAA